MTFSGRSFAKNQDQRDREAAIFLVYYLIYAVPAGIMYLLLDQSYSSRPPLSVAELNLEVGVGFCCGAGSIALGMMQGDVLQPFDLWRRRVSISLAWAGYFLLVGSAGNLSVANPDRSGLYQVAAFLLACAICTWHQKYLFKFGPQATYSIGQPVTSVCKNL